MDTFVDYACAVIGMMFLSYFILKLRKEQLLDDMQIRKHGKEWKNVIRLFRDAVVMCDSSRILFTNEALRAIVLREAPNANLLVAVVLVSILS